MDEDLIKDHNKVGKKTGFTVVRGKKEGTVSNVKIKSNGTFEVTR